MLRFHHLKRANSFTFWFWCNSLISPVTYNETIRRFTWLVRLVVLLLFIPYLRLRDFKLSFPAYAVFITY